MCTYRFHDYRSAARNGSCSCNGHCLSSSISINHCRVFSTANWTCPVGYSRCYDSRQCVLDYYFNDGENDCNVGTDELGGFSRTNL